MVNSNDLAIQRTKFANQRTYLAYIRTGFGIAGIAGTFKKYWIVVFGIIMIITSSIQYYIINKDLDEKELYNHHFDIVPIMYTILMLGILYLQWKK